MTKRKVNSVMMRVDPMFKDLFQTKSDKIGVNMTDLTRILAIKNENKDNVFVMRERRRTKRKALFDLEMEDPFNFR